LQPQKINFRQAENDTATTVGGALYVVLFAMMLFEASTKPSRSKELVPRALRMYGMFHRQEKCDRAAVNSAYSY
jgi:hypothetical protein